MKELFEQGLIEKRESEQAVSYLLKDEELFSQTRMKALESSRDPRVLKCVKTLYNGRTKLVYMTGAYRRLDQCLPVMEGTRYQELALKLIREMLNIRENSILSCTCVDLEPNRVFLDWGSLDVRLVCLPVKDRAPLPEAEFESYLRVLLVRWIRMLPPAEQGKLSMLEGQLGDPKTTLNGLLNPFGMEPEPSVAEPLIGEPPAEQPWQTQERKLVLRSIGVTPALSFEITHTPFLLGRKRDAVDGVIPPEYMRIGRRHCRIEREGDGFCVVDENSMNGTWVNDIRVRALGSAGLAQGSILRLANLAFTVNITGETVRKPEMM